MSDPQLFPGVNTGMTLDTIKFINAFIIGVKKDYDFAYPYKTLDSTRCHGVLQSINGRVAILDAFINSLK